MDNLVVNKTPVFLGIKGISYFNSFLEKNKKKKIFIFLDSNVKKFCLQDFLLLFPICKDAIVLEINAGESSKSIDITSSIFVRLINKNADKDSLFINLGGGVISDLGGFIASVFNRGISYINFPTTLLAQVDASIGGKTGINFNRIKNKIGVINNPIFVIVLTDFLKTIPNNQLVSAYAEIYKYALIQDFLMWKDLSVRNIYDLDGLEKIILKSIKIKQSIINQDLYEKGSRKILNFGHTIGHAIESVFFENPQVNHGLSVVMGMICELYISHILLGFPKKDLHAITKLFFQKFPLIKLNNLDQVIYFVTKDKKNKNGIFLFSLIPKIGSCYFDQSVGEQIIKESLAYYNSFYE